VWDSCTKKFSDWLFTLSTYALEVSLSSRCQEIDIGNKQIAAIAIAEPHFLFVIIIG
jgi:hypothetical protein